MAWPSAGSLAERTVGGALGLDCARFVSSPARRGLCRSQIGKNVDGAKGNLFNRLLRPSSGDGATWHRSWTSSDLPHRQCQVYAAARGWSTVEEMDVAGGELSAIGEGRGTTERLETGGEAGEVSLAVALQLELQLLLPGLLSTERDASTPEGVMCLITEMASPSPNQSTWRKQINSVSPRCSDPRVTTSEAVSASGRALQLTPALQQQKRPLGMILLERSFRTLLEQGHACSGLVGLVEHMIQQELPPDTPLAMFLLKELWTKGQEDAAVKLLVLLHKEGERVGGSSGQEGCSERCQQHQNQYRESHLAQSSNVVVSETEHLRAGSARETGAQLPERAVVQKKAGHSRELMRHIDAGAETLNVQHKHSSSRSITAASYPLLDRRKAAAAAETSGQVESNASPASVHGSQGSALPLPTTEGAPRPWPVPRVGDLPASLRRGVTEAEPKQHPECAQDPGSARVERLARLRAEVRRRMHEEIARSLEQVTPPPVIGAGRGGAEARLSRVGPSSTLWSSSDPADLVLHVLRCAIDRGQFRAALALPRRLRQEGVCPSVAAYDAALLAVVKEQELLSDAEHEVQELQSLARVERASPVDQLIIQVYGETLRGEGEALLGWALKDLHQASALSSASPATAEEKALVAANQEASLHEKMLALWCLAGEGAKGERALWRMAEAGRRLSRDVVAAVLGTCAYRRDMEAVHRVLSRTEAMGLKPDSALFSLIIGAALKGGHMQGAAAAMLSMVERGLTPERSQMATLLRLLQRDGHVESYLVLSSALSGAGFIGPCLVYFYLDFIRFCIIRML